jgi:hypothetical protein
MDAIMLRSADPAADAVAAAEGADEAMAGALGEAGAAVAVPSVETGG